MTTAELAELVARITYKAGWSFAALGRAAPRYPLRHGERLRPRHDHRPADRLSPLPAPILRRPADVVRWLAWRLARIETHEVREWLLLDGARVLDPHDGVERT